MEQETCEFCQLGIDDVGEVVRYSCCGGEYLCELCHKEYHEIEHNQD